MAIENTRWNAYKSLNNVGFICIGGRNGLSTDCCIGLLHWEVTTLGWINA